MLTYYAYLAWVIFATLLVVLIYRIPPLGALWALVVLARITQFVRLSLRSSERQAFCNRATGASASVLAGECTMPPAQRVPDPPARTGVMVGPATDGEHVCIHTPTMAADAATCPSTCPCTCSCSCSCASRCCMCVTTGNANVVNQPQLAEASLPPAIDATMTQAAAVARSLGSVLLVGNGPSIRERSLGSVIDSFDTVVRFNSFVTKGLEEHTGSKTSLWCHMMQWYHVSTVEIAQKATWLPTCYAWNHVVLAPLIFIPNYLMPMIPPPSGITWSLSTYWRAHRALCLRVHQVPTTGFVMLTRLLESVECVHLVGFDGFGSGCELHYYKEQQMQVRVNAAGALMHDWAKEQAAIQHLISLGRVVLL